MIVEPWRWMNSYVSTQLCDLSRLLRAESGVYLIARPAHRSRVSVRDVVYIGLAGESRSASGTFHQRINSHGLKLQRGAEAPGCPTLWARYHNLHGGPDSLGSHALRLIRMPAQTFEDKAAIGRLEDVLLLMWQQIRDSQPVRLPPLNARFPDVATISSIYQGPIEGEGDDAVLAPVVPVAPTPMLAQEVAQPGDPLETLWPNDDAALEQAELLESYRQFFEARGRGNTWASWMAALPQGLSFRVIAIQNLVRNGRPGELRLVTDAPGARRASMVHAIIVPNLDAQDATVELRLRPEQLPPQFIDSARQCDRGKMQSRLFLPADDISDVISLFT